ncbi:MAG: hypothetical protein C4307_02140 [Chloroflexota bacterium]
MPGSRRRIGRRADQRFRLFRCHAPERAGTNGRSPTDFRPVARGRRALSVQTAGADTRSGPRCPRWVGRTRRARSAVRRRRAWRGKEVAFQQVWIATLVLVALGFLLTFPPFFGRFAAE